MKLYTYWRSSASYRLRIALALKGLRAEQIPVHLIKNGGEHMAPSYRALNPAGTVPTLLLESGVAITQSLAAIEYIDELWPDPPLLPQSSEQRALARSLAMLIAADIHPLCNLKVGIFLKDKMHHTQEDWIGWMKHFMHLGFAAYEAQIQGSSLFSLGDTPQLPDICLIPQLYNAHRWGVDLTPYPRLQRIEENALANAAFRTAYPENQPDSEQFFA